jgi:TolA-binding protein
MRLHRAILHLLAFPLLLAGPGTTVAQNSKENADFKLAINLFNDGLFDLASEQLRQFIGAYPATPQGIDARFYLGLVQMKLKKFDDARLTFQSFALTYQDNPKAPEAWWNVGESYVAMGTYREAALAFERVKVFHPKSKSAPDALLKATKYFLLAGAHDDARRTLRVILQEYPASDAVLAARTQLGQMYFEEGNYDQAQSELKRVIEGDPSPDARAGALLILGNISRATGRTDNAQSNYREIVTKYPKSSAVQGAYLNLGKLVAAGGKNAEALEWFKKAIAEKSATDSLLVRDALVASGDAQAALGDHSAAAASYEKYLVAVPQGERSPEVLWKLATAAGQARDYRRSNDACNRLLRSAGAEPLKRRARLKLALNAEEQKNFPAALQYFETFTDANPEYFATPEILLREARLCAGGVADARKAVSIFEQIAARYPSTAVADDALAGAGRGHEQLKEFDRALQSYRELIARYPASEYRGEADERLKIIETFEAKEKDAGLEKLALLVGDVVSDKDKADLAYRLGEIYFSDLKSYAAAATQFGNALEAGLSGERAGDALLKKAESLEYLSWKDRQEIPRAVAAYRAYLASPTTAPDSDRALLATFRLSATTLAAGRQAAAELMTRDPSFPMSDVVRLTMGKLYEQADSVAAAGAEYAEAGRRARDRTVAEEAAYRSLGLLFRLDAADSALAAGTRFLAAYTGSGHAAEVLSRLGDLAMKNKIPVAAAGFYQKLKGEYAYTTLALEAQEKLAEALAAAGETEAALSAYGEISRHQTDDPMGDGEPSLSVLMALGKLQREAGNAAEAKRFLTAVLARVQTGLIAGEAYTTLGLIYRAEGLREAATSYFRQAETAAPGSGVTRDIADLLFENGDYRDAIREYTQLSGSAAGDTERQYFDSRIILAMIRNGDGPNAEKAIALFDKKYRDAHDDIALFELEKGLLQFRREEFTGAMKAFQHVADKFEDSPSGPTAMYWIGKTLEATEKPREAVDLLEKLLASHPQAPVITHVHLALGNLYYGAEKWDQAIKHYRVIVDDPHPDQELLPSAMSNLIETYEVAAAYDGALTLTRRYLELYPNSDDALDKKIKIGILYDHLGYYDQAVLHLQSLLDEAGSDLEGEIRYYIAEANYHKGDYQQAILDFLKVPYLVTKKGKIDWTANSLYMSGQSYEKMGRYDQALTMYQQIVDRTGIDETFKSAARKEIDRVRTVLKKKPG